MSWMGRVFGGEKSVFDDNVVLPDDNVDVVNLGIISLGGAIPLQVSVKEVVIPAVVRTLVKDSLEDMEKELCRMAERGLEKTEDYQGLAGVIETIKTGKTHTYKLVVTTRSRGVGDDDIKRIRGEVDAFLKNNNIKITKMHTQMDVRELAEKYRR